MIDTLIKNHEVITSEDSFNLEEFNIDKEYFVLTIHRPVNLTDENLSIIFDGLKHYVNDYDIVIPAHPRLKKFIEKNNISTSSFKIINPQPYIKFLSLVYNSALCLTDSGGLQEETTYLNKKCLTLRKNTERPITITQGTNCLVDFDYELLNEKIFNNRVYNNIKIEKWDGNTSNRIYESLKCFL